MIQKRDSAHETNGNPDKEDAPIRVLFKLYPYEWMAAEEFGKHLVEAGCRLIEPPWKSVLSNKAILPVLWDLYPGHPNLLPAYFSPDQFIRQDYVQKPFFSREGANITVRQGSATQTTEGKYGAEGFIYQQYVPMPDFGGQYPVLGSWVIGDHAAGIGIREDDTQITQDTSRFVPHYFD